MNPFHPHPEPTRVGMFVVLIGALILMCITGIANSQTPNTRVTNCNTATPTNALCLEWTAPATMADGSPTVLALNYRVQQRVGTAGTFTTIGTNLTVLKLYVENLAPGEYFYRVFAGCTGCTAESAASNTASKSATAPPVVPGAPILIIAATIRAGQPPTWRIIYTVTPRTDELVFVAPEAMRSVFAKK